LQLLWLTDYVRDTSKLDHNWLHKYNFWMMSKLINTGR